MSLAERINRVLIAMSLLPDAGATDYSKVRVSTGKAGSSAPPRGDNLALDWDRRFGRLVRAAEHELQVYRGRGRIGRGDRTRRILTSYVDETPSFVAFVEDMSTEGVRKLRARHNRDPETGRRLRPISGPEEDA